MAVVLWRVLAIPLLMFPLIAAACCADSFNVTYLCTTVPSHPGRGQLNRTLFFEVHDPDPATNATTLCGHTWPSNSTAPKAWTSCEDPSFEWQFGSDFTALVGYVDFRDFGLSVRHTFKDPTIGQGIWGYRTAEGWLGFTNATNLECWKGDGMPEKGCELLNGMVANIPILVES